VAHRLARHAVEETQQPVCAKLSDRELEVLQRVAAGQTNREICAALHISEKAVEKRLSSIYLKLHAASRAEAAVAAMQQGLLVDKP
jgi:DNA-binding NarL/FixJ family response regulator